MKLSGQIAMIASLPCGKKQRVSACSKRKPQQHSLPCGQKQRVCIARALVKKPKILIMDDCLSALDTETEEKIIKSLNEYIKDTTTIISSHRISSIQNLDKIIVLNDGKIIQKGSHEELINENGYYKQLYFKQLTEKED